MYTIVISGGRDYRSYFEFARRMDKVLKTFDKRKLVLMEGGARGTDYLVYIYAKRRKIPCVTVPADWDTHGKKAGMIRNREMIENANFFIAFWDGESKGTKNAIELAHRYNITKRVLRYERKPDGQQKKGYRPRSTINGRVLSEDEQLEVNYGRLARIVGRRIQEPC